jgi:hypothetical protein
MSCLSKLVKAVIDTAGLPVAIIKDVFTLGGAILGEKEPYTLTKLKDIGDDIEEAKGEL